MISSQLNYYFLRTPYKNDVYFFLMICKMRISFNKMYFNVVIVIKKICTSHMFKGHMFHL